ncbi:MAG: hypothetical protein ABJF10_11875 [Chthoniobacter sp.]|uniref:alpha/beta fold hydrolase n=1 Tax=Chthoniobacter sp. TaxID=2510640 RepID=UPI0032AA4786
MSDIAGIPYIEAKFDKNGNPDGPAPVLPADTNEVFVFSHGWNNDNDEARTLYRTFFTNYAAVSGPVPPGRQRCIVGILWPSKALDDVVKAAVADAGTGGSGPAASTGGGSQAGADAAIKAQLDEVQKLLGSGSETLIADLKKLVPDLQDSTTKQHDFVDKLRAQLTSQHTDNDEEPSSHPFLVASGPNLLKTLSQPAPVPAAGAPKPKAKGAGGGAAGLGDIFGGIKGGVIKFLNLFSYFEMKERAGTVGSTGVATLLDKLGASVERIHLIGHSFGGRVVTAAAKASTTKNLKTMSLLQAAFSHNGFRPGIGFFRSVVEDSRIKGVVIATHTFNDSAVGIAYPAASLLGGETAADAKTAGIAAAVGGPNSPFGGLGSNGALHLATDLAFFIDMVAVGKAYDFKVGKIYNLEAHDLITEHGDVANANVAYAVASAHKAAG